MESGRTHERPWLTLRDGSPAGWLVAPLPFHRSANVTEVGP
ncbi:MAG: hypothetical protein ACTHQQ_02405 [Solirubrobacteraceae bacterium]